MMETESREPETDTLGQIMCFVLIMYGAIWTVEGYIEIGMVDIWGALFFLLGLIWLVVRVERARIVLSILGVIGGFFGASYWGFFYGIYQNAWICAALSIVVFVASGAMLCNYLCTWPDYKWTGGN